MSTCEERILKQTKQAHLKSVRKIFLLIDAGQFPLSEKWNDGMATQHPSVWVPVWSLLESWGKILLEQF